MATIRIPAPLRPYAGGQGTVEVAAGDVSAALAELGEQFPELRQHLFEGDSLRSFVNLYLDRRDIHDLDGLQTTLRDSDTLLIVPSVAGG